jgi:hypothetical protein
MNCGRLFQCIGKSDGSLWPPAPPAPLGPSK